MHQKPADRESLLLSFQRFGAGEKAMFTFHGFGEDASRFEIFGPVFGKRFSIYSFDLPFHGENKSFQQPEVISRDQLKAFFSVFLEKERIDHFVVVGYSIGAKFALNLIQLFPEKISRVILIAPDGLKINFWYRVATGTGLTRMIFRRIVDRPGLFLRLADLSGSAGLVHPSVIRFARSQMASHQKREQVYNTWTSFRKLNLDLTGLGECIHRHQIPVDIAFGEKDRIIRYKDLKPLMKYLPDAAIIRLASGHQQLVEDTLAYYADQLF